MRRQMTGIYKLEKPKAGGILVRVAGVRCAAQTERVGATWVPRHTADEARLLARSSAVRVSSLRDLRVSQRA